MHGVTPKSRLVEFGGKIMMVEHELRTQGLEWRSSRKDEVGRVAGMDYVEALPDEEAQEQPEFPCESDQILKTVAEQVGTFRRNGMPVDIYSLQDLTRSKGTRLLRADHGDTPPS